MALLTILTIPMFIASVALGLVTYYLLYLCNAFLLSPIASIPGSALGIAFPPIGWWKLATGTAYAWKFNLHKKFGAILLRVHDIRKARFYQDIKMDPEGPDAVLTICDKPYHRKVRLAISPAFSIRFLAGLEDQMDAVWHVLECKLKDEARKSEGRGYANVDLVEMFAAVALDIITSTSSCLGIPHHTDPLANNVLQNPATMPLLALLTIPAILASLAISLLTYYLLYLLDAFVRSPIASIPGSALDIACPPIGWWNLISGRGSLWKFDLHERFGGIVRIDSKTISIADPILAQKDPDGLLTISDKEYHRKTRLAMSPAFSIRFLAGLEDQMDGVWKVLENKLKDEARQGHGYAKEDLVELFAAVALDVISSTAFGESLNAIHRGDHPVRTAGRWNTIITVFHSIMPFNMYAIPWCMNTLQVQWNHLAA
ncbi:hypothetical protein M427DRAFT_33548 [Gonapodya prolifera JEL478]|uniref:Cytochrome P450 n=1 Tax=Gonapodya prolifera (strain JEL478) TaxID=1344416 RepID=A0A139AB48_GONPJ|nr:hypothetical protein M427DRAFT_33548 [Gonapodya prolifera JEL478]|eukprot:KXS13894.1 hypothetical protein M427DRAFT_33548 [Gonapodya prolifera JEL478]